jgi:DNA repair exonuclease SbcCD nuclease subunit
MENVINNPKRNALIATDLHIRPQHIEAAKIVLDKIIEEVKLKKPTYLFLLGDIFHYKDRLFASCLSVFHDFLEEVTPLCKVVCLVGNHDWGVPYTVHSLDSFRHIENLTIVDDIYQLDEENAFISYCREKERFDEMVSKLGPNTIRIFGHLDINDFKVGSGWEEVNAYSQPGDFSRFKQVFSGHLHLAQERRLENGTEIIFVGTSYTTDFGESDQFKRFILLDLNTGEYESIDTNMTLHKTLKIKAGDPFPILDEIEINRGVEFRVVVSGTKDQLSLIERPKNYLGKIVYDMTAIDSARVDLSATDSRQDTLKKYIDYEVENSFDGEKSGFDKDRLLRIGETILNKFN